MPGTDFINDLKNAVVAADTTAAIAPQVAAAAITGTVIDMVDADGPCFGVLNVGAVTSLTSLDVKVQESDASAGTYTDISGAAFPQITAAQKLKVINFKRSKRFVRAMLAMTGTSAIVACNILGIKKSQ
jgi:hypothetical protein